jgi:hypothetical protein
MGTLEYKLFRAIEFCIEVPRERQSFPSLLHIDISLKPHVHEEGADSRTTLPSKFPRWDTDSATNHDGQFRQERSILKVLLTIRSEERVMKTYLDSAIPIVVGYARLHMSVCAKVDSVHIKNCPPYIREWMRRERLEREADEGSEK